VLRERGLTGAKRSCDLQVCGTCTVLLDDLPVSACCVLAADAHGRSVETVEGLAATPAFERYREVLARDNVFQCGFCAPGFVLTLHAARERGALRSRADVVHELSGNLCRCTGYRAILDAAVEIAGLAPEDVS
jgi:aerobic carbon-monoxide dehydrogenase small subunit